MKPDIQPRRSFAASLLMAIAAFLTSSPIHAMTPANRFFFSGAQAALEAAIRVDDSAAISRAIHDGASVNAVGKFKVTPLMVAVDTQSPRAVQALLAAGASPNARAQDGNGPVSLAVKSCRANPYGPEIMLAIFKGGGDPDTRQPDGDPILMRFILDHDAAGLALMKSLGANLNILDRGGDPLITNVAMSQDWDMVWALIELGVEVDYEHGKSRQPLSLALKGRYPAPDSPLYPYKLKVWHFLKDKGIALPPLDR
jgi:ankyrin repeat protein